MTAETKTFRIYGASDDLVETEGVPGCDEFNVNPDPDRGRAFAGSFVLAGPDGTMRIMAFYAAGRTGTWCFAPCQMDEGVPMPLWPMCIRHNEPRPGVVGYSTELEIEVPAGTTLIAERDRA